LISLSVISGVTIMSVTFFSVKERIPEIGIRKAFGAKKRDILGQFMVEMLIMGVFASIMAVIVGIILCHLIEYFVSKKLFIDFSMYYSVKQFLLPIFIGICEIIGFAVSPSFYAANINVIKSLKFE
jgi:putative ABC transport system permease protein